MTPWYPMSASPMAPTMTSAREGSHAGMSGERKASTCK
jgi:hypothetical protein